MRSLVERGVQAPLLIVATTRPEFRPPWTMRSHHGVISLAPLDRAQVRRMVGEIASRHALSDEMIDGVGERTGGVPLFVEEVTRLLLERDAQGGAQAIPPTLQQSLAARLDRLGEAREVAQIGAVLGRDFLTGCSATCRQPPPDSTSCACKPRWIGSWRPTSCSSAAPLRRPPTASSTR
jgi:Predicted ATPase